MGRETSHERASPKDSPKRTASAERDGKASALSQPGASFAGAYAAYPIASQIDRLGNHGALRLLRQLQGGAQRKSRAAGTAPAVQLAPAEGPQRECAPKCTCTKCAESNAEEKMLQAGVQPAAAREAPANVDPSSVHERLHGGGPLPEHVAARFSHGYGSDLSDVRVHTESTLASELGARAFTVGNDVAFAPGEFQPGTQRGDRLIGHELAHVVQQSGGTSGPQTSLASARSYEDEADRAASTVLSGGRVAKISALEGTVQRQPPDAGAPTPTPAPAPTPAPGTNPPAPAPAPAPGKPDDQQEPKTTSETFFYDGVDWSVDDDDYNYRSFRRWYIAHSRAQVPGFLVGAADAFVKKYPDQDGTKLRSLGRAYQRVLQEATDYDTQFEGLALAKLSKILDESHERVEAERVKYGLPDPETQMEYGQESAPVDPNAPVKGPQATALATAAGLMLQLRDDHDKAVKEHEDKLHQIDGQLMYDFGTTSGIDPAQFGENSSYQAHWNDLQAQRNGEKKAQDLENRTFEVKKAELTGRYPILAAFADSETDLKALQSGTSDQVSLKLQYKIFEVLRNIKAARRDFTGEDVWTHPHLVDATRLENKVADGTFEDRSVKDKVQQVSDDEFWKSIGLGAAQLFLTLLAGETLGLSMIGVAAISGYQLGTDIDKYSKELTLVGTDFDKAKAISQDDPSMFTIAMDAVFFTTDVAGAVGALHAVEDGVRALRTAKTAEEIKTAEDAIKAGAKGHPQEFADAVLRDARASTSTTSTAEQLFGKEGHALEEVEKVAAKEAEQAVLSTGEGVGGATLTITKKGNVVICSSPCMWLRDRYAKVIQGNADFEARLASVENKAARAAEATDEAVSKKLGAEALEDEKALHRDLAYQEHVQAGGTGSLEDFEKQADRFAHLRSHWGEATEDELKELRAQRAANGELTFEPGSPEHKLQRWEEYKAHPNTEGWDWDRWSNNYNHLMSKPGGEFEQAALKQYGYTKQTQTLRPPGGGPGSGFIPESVPGSTGKLQWGKPYHFVEVKDWQYIANATDTNLAQMLDYVEKVDGSSLTLIIRSKGAAAGETVLSGPLSARLGKLEEQGKVVVQRFPPVPKPE